MGAVAGGFALLLIAPVVELFIVLVKILNIPLRIWKNSAKRLFGKMHGLLAGRGIIRAFKIGAQKGEFRWVKGA